MTTPTGGSRPLGPDPTAALPVPPRDVSPPRDVRPPRDVPPSRDSRPPGGARPAAAAATAVPLTPRERDGRDGPDRRRRAPLAWLPWALLAALLGLLALSLLAGTLAGPDRAVGRTDGSASDGVTSGAAGSDTGPGTLQVGDTDLLGSREALARLGAAQGQRAVGRGLRIESVVADEGFWVGRGPADRVFVYLTPQARRGAGESGPRYRAGATVDVDGTVTGTSAGDPARFGITDAEGARQLTAQRAYVRASQVRPTSS